MSASKHKAYSNMSLRGSQAQWLRGLAIVLVSLALAGAPAPASAASEYLAPRDMEELRKQSKGCNSCVILGVDSDRRSAVVPGHRGPRTVRLGATPMTL